MNPRRGETVSTTGASVGAKPSANVSVGPALAIAPLLSASLQGNPAFAAAAMQHAGHEAATALQYAMPGHMHGSAHARGEHSPAVGFQPVSGVKRARGPQAEEHHAFKFHVLSDGQTLPAGSALPANAVQQPPDAQAALLNHALPQNHSLAQQHSAVPGAHLQYLAGQQVDALALLGGHPASALLGAQAVGLKAPGSAHGGPVHGLHGFQGMPGPEAAHAALTDSKSAAPGGPDHHRLVGVQADLERAMGLQHAWSRGAAGMQPQMPPTSVHRGAFVVPQAATGMLHGPPGPHTGAHAGAGGHPGAAPPGAGQPHGPATTPPHPAATQAALAAQLQDPAFLHNMSAMMPYLVQYLQQLQAAGWLAGGGMQLQAFLPQPAVDPAGQNWHFVQHKQVHPAVHMPGMMGMLGSEVAAHSHGAFAAPAATPSPPFCAPDPPDSSKQAPAAQRIGSVQAATPPGGGVRTAGQPPAVGVRDAEGARAPGGAADMAVRRAAGPAAGAVSVVREEAGSRQQALPATSAPVPRGSQRTRDAAAEAPLHGRASTPTARQPGAQEGTEDDGDGDGGSGRASGEAALAVVAADNASGAVAGPSAEQAGVEGWGGGTVDVQSLLRLQLMLVDVQRRLTQEQTSMVGKLEQLLSTAMAGDATVAEEAMQGAHRAVLKSLEIVRQFQQPPLMPPDAAVAGGQSANQAPQLQPAISQTSLPTARPVTWPEAAAQSAGAAVVALSGGRGGEQAQQAFRGQAVAAAAQAESVLRDPEHGQAVQWTQAQPLGRSAAGAPGPAVAARREAGGLAREGGPAEAGTPEASEVRAAGTRDSQQPASRGKDSDTE